MIIYKDKLSENGKELCSDAYPMCECFGGLFLKVRAKRVQRSGGDVDPSLLGSNPSQEEQEEQLEGAGVETGLDVVMDYKLEEVQVEFSKKQFTKYYMNYLSSLSKVWDADQKKKFKEMKPKFDEFVDIFDADNCSIYTHEYVTIEKGSSDGMPVLGVWDGADNMDLYFFNWGLEEEKC